PRSDVWKGGRYVRLIVGTKARQASSQPQLQAVAQGREGGSGGDDPATRGDQFRGRAQRAPRRLEMLDHLDHRDAVHDRQILRLLSGNLVKSHILPEVIGKPAEGVMP